VEEEEKEVLDDDEFLAFKGYVEEQESQMEEFRIVNPIPDSIMTDVTKQFSDEQLADSEKVQELEEHRKMNHERNKTISLVYLYAQPMVDENSDKSLQAMNVAPLDNYGEYRKLMRPLEKSG
jgi:hypothetical protein